MTLAGTRPPTLDEWNKYELHHRARLAIKLGMENPFIVHNISRRERNMQLASIEDAWEQLDIYITDELWDKFISLFKEVLIESEPIFEYPFEKHFEASIYAEKPEWSQTLKRGMGFE